MIINEIPKGQRLVATRRINGKKYVFNRYTEYLEIDTNIFECRFEETKNRGQLKLNI